MKYTLIKKNGTKVQMDGHVSAHISDTEAQCHCCGQAILFEQTIALFEKTRELVGKPIPINSFYRCMKHQEELVESGAKAAKTFPPHTYGFAIDLGLPTGMTAVQLMGYVKQAAKALGLPVPRCGHKTYGETFLHVDLAFLVKPNPCPSAWYPGAEW